MTQRAGGVNARAEHTDEKCGALGTLKPSLAAMPYAGLTQQATRHRAWSHEIFQRNAAQAIGTQLLSISNAPTP